MRSVPEKGAAGGTGLGGIHKTFTRFYTTRGAAPFEIGRESALGEAARPVHFSLCWGDLFFDQLDSAPAED